MNLTFNEIKNALMDLNVLQYGSIYKVVPRKYWSDTSYSFISVSLTNGLHPDYDDEDAAYEYKIACQNFIEKKLQTMFPKINWRVGMNDSGNFDIDFDKNAVLFETKYSLKKLLNDM